MFLLVGALGFSSNAQICSEIENHRGLPYLKVASSSQPISVRLDPSARSASFGELHARDLSNHLGVKVNQSQPAAGDCSHTLGVTGFRDRKGFWLLDFDKGQWCQLNIDQGEFSKRGFRRVEGRCGNDGFWIEIQIRRKPIRLQADFGWAGAIALNDTKYLMSNDDYIYFDTENGKVKLFPRQRIYFLESLYSTCIRSSNGTARAGLGLLRGFDWIFDFGRGTIYAKKNSIGIVSDSPIIEVASIGDKLVVVGSADSSIQPGESIRSVDGQEVTSGNLCALMADIRQSGVPHSIEISGP